MNEKIKQVFKKLCENYVSDINQFKGKKIAQDYFYNDEYEFEYRINGEWVATADILKAFDSMEELIKGKDEYIAKLCNDRAELKAELKKIKDILAEYDFELKDFREACLLLRQWRSENLCWIDYEEQKIKLKELKEFARIVIEKDVKPSFIKRNSLGTYNNHIEWNYEEQADNYMLTQTEFELVKKVVEKYGKKED